jgi:hypothetical protein
VPFLFLELLLVTSKVELSTCAAGVGCLSHFAVLDSPVLRGTVVVRLADRVGRLLGECDARGPEYSTGSTVTLIRASPVSMRKDFEGDARELCTAEECAIGDAMLRWVYVCPARGEEARCSGSGDSDPESDDIWSVSCRVVVSFLHFRVEGFVLLFPDRWNRVRVQVALVGGVSRQCYSVISYAHNYMRYPVQ